MVSREVYPAPIVTGPSQDTPIPIIKSPFQLEAALTDIGVAEGLLPVPAAVGVTPADRNGVAEGREYSATVTTRASAGPLKLTVTVSLPAWIVGA
jgi:hypothetical protein